MSVHFIQVQVRWLFSVTLLLAFAGPAAAWQQSGRDEPPSSAVDQPQDKPREERRISPKREQELFAKLDEVLRFASADTKLPIRRRVERKLVSREEARELMARRRKEEDDRIRRQRRSEVVLKKFGLLPRDFQLEKFLAELQEEQVAGFYDSRTGTVYLLDWLDFGAQFPVLAHELTHALQDQVVGLEDWLKEGNPGKKEVADSEAGPVALDERALARRALVEGQAMHVLVNYTMAAAQAWAGPAGARSRSVQSSPEFAAMFDRQKRSPVLDSAPLFIRESLAFPYTYGFLFVQEVANRRGREEAFAGLLRDPPRNSYQILHPRSYLSGERFEPLRLPAITPLLGEGRARFDDGTMGALEVALFLRQFAGEGTARKLARKWRGGFYYAATGAAAEGDEGGEGPSGVTPASLTLLYVSRWESAEDAARFAGAYSAALPKRYLRVSASAAEVSTRGSVTHIGAPTRWSTEEGLVVVEACGDTVLVLESFDRATANRLRAALLGTCPAAGAVQ